MIPKTILSENIETEDKAIKTYKLNKKEKTIDSFIDGRDAVEQMVYCHLNIERYQWLIYSWNIGIETLDLYGEPMMWVCSEVERRVKETLSIINEVEEVDNFEFTIEKRKLLCSFTVKSIYGDFTANEEVSV